MLAQSAGKLGDRRYTCPQCISRPRIKEATSPIGRHVVPELVELFLEKVRPDGPQVDAQQLTQASRLPGGQPMLALEQHATGMLKCDRIALLAKLACLVPPDLLDRLAEELHHVEAVQDVHGGTGLRATVPTNAAHMSEVMNSMAAQRSLPSQSKKRPKVAAVRSRPIHNNRLR